MAKVAFTKLNLKVNQDVATIDFGDQKVEVKRYLPVDEKMKMISNILNNSGDDTGFYNIGKVEMNIVLNIVFNYTNITFTEKQKENSTKLYDQIISSGLWEDIYKCMAESEINYIRTTVYHTMDKIYEYRNSVYGILDALNTDYKDLDLDALEIQKNLGDPENLKELKSIVEKLG